MCFSAASLQCPSSQPARCSLTSGRSRCCPWASPWPPGAGREVSLGKMCQEISGGTTECCQLLGTRRWKHPRSHPSSCRFLFLFLSSPGPFWKENLVPVKDQPPNNKPKVFLGWAVQIPSPGAGSIWGCHIEIFLAGSKDKAAAPGVLHGF